MKTIILAVIFHYLNLGDIQMSKSVLHFMIELFELLNIRATDSKIDWDYYFLFHDNPYILWDPVSVFLYQG